MKELHIAQREGNVKMIKANKDGSREIPEHEAHLMHVSIEKREFDSETGEKKSKPRYRAFDVTDFLRMTKERAFIGQHVEIVHDPRTKDEQAKTPAVVKGPKLDANVEKMPEPKLRELFKALFGEEADVLMEPDELRRLITEKQEFLVNENKKKTI